MFQILLHSTFVYNHASSYRRVYNAFYNPWRRIVQLGRLQAANTNASAGNTKSGGAIPLVMESPFLPNFVCRSLSIYRL